MASLTSKLAGWTEGSLLKRTLLHVSAFVLGSLAFLGIASLVLTSIASSVLPSHDPKEPKEGDKDVAALVPSGAATSRPAGLKGPGKKRPMLPGKTDPSSHETPPPSDDE